MSDKPINPLLSAGPRAAKFRYLWTPQYMIPMGIILFIGFLGVLILLQPHLWLRHQSSNQDIINLKNESAILSNRIEQLEATHNASAANSIDQERFKDIETRISSVFQKLEAIQNQPKDVSPQQIERSNVLEKELGRIVEIQNNLKSLLLFWRLKAVILSDAPYRAELNDLKSVTKESEELAFLEKYADYGLQSLKDNQRNELSIAQSGSKDSWWDRMKSLISSFVKIEKMDTSVTMAPTALQERQTVEEVIRQIEQTLIQPLLTSPLASSPQSGDVL